MSDDLPWGKVYIFNHEDPYMGHTNDFDKDTDYDVSNGRFIPESEARELYEKSKWVDTAIPDGWCINLSEWPLMDGRKLKDVLKENAALKAQLLESDYAFEVASEERELLSKENAALKTKLFNLTADCEAKDKIIGELEDGKK